MDNPEIRLENKKSKPSYSVEGETIIIKFEDPWINNNLI